MQNKKPLEVLLTGKLHPEIIKELSELKGVNIHNHPDTIARKLTSILPATNVLITRSETAIDRELMQLMPELKYVIRAAVGVGNIDLDTSTEKGILVMNCPGKNTNSAAELCMGLLLSLMRNLHTANTTVKNGGWDRHKFSGNELRGKKVAVIGLGNVGHRIAKFLNGFDAKVVGYDPYISKEKFKDYGVKMAESLESAIEGAEVLTVHTPLNADTKGLIGAPQLELLARGSVVINGARGGIVDELALLRALDSGKVSKAGIDTWENEPTPLEGLTKHPSVMCSPHIGATTIEAQIAIGKAVVAQLRQAISDQIVDHPVNLPGIEKIEHPIIQQYAVLSEKLGAIASSVLGFQPDKIEVKVRGEISAMKHSTLPIAFAKGFMRGKSTEHVSFVNAKKLLEKSGVEIFSVKDEKFTAYRSAIKIIVHGQNKDGKSAEWKIGGTVFEDKLQRLSVIENFYFEVEPRGNLLIFENQDEPGVVGNIGTLLGQHSVNIQSFDLARNRKTSVKDQPKDGTKTGLAMAVVRTDSPVSKELLTKLGSLPHIRNAWFIVL